MELTDKEMQGLDAIITAGKDAAGDRSEGWWSEDVLAYSPDCLLTPRQFAAVCGTLVKKGAVVSWEHEPGQRVIAPTAAGLAAYDNALDVARLQAIDQAMLRNAQ